MIKKPLSCKLRPSDINTDLECLLLSEVGSYEKIIKELLYDIHEEFSGGDDPWNDIWSFDDVIERFDKGEILWLVLKDENPISCSWISVKSNENLFIYNTWLKPKLRGTDLFRKISLVRNDRLHTLGYEKLLCVTDNIRAEKGLKKIGYKEDNWMDIQYIFWTGGYDSTFLVCKFLLENRLVQPIYIDDRINHGGYHSNPLVKQRGGDTYPRKSTEIELERMDWLRQRIYEKIEKSKYLLLKTMVIDKPIEEDEEISKVVEKYNEWIPNTISEKGWLPVYTDLVSRFQKQFGLEIFWANDHIEGEFYEVFDDSIEDGRMKVDKLPSKYKDLKIFSGLVQPLRHTNKKEMLEDAKQKGFDDLLYYTWTCWYPNNREPCGECHVCNERIIECKEITNE